MATQLELLNSVENCWQPSDYLPESTGDNWPEQVRELRDQAKSIPDELLVVLVGDMVTEEALPTYQSLLNGFEGCLLYTSPSPRDVEESRMPSSA